jgi:hypothetical protein
MANLVNITNYLKNNVVIKTLRYYYKNQEACLSVIAYTMRADQKP